jgi:uncharacterized glyoxalase superfamily metalloenzyme YdcJ
VQLILLYNAFMSVTLELHPTLEAQLRAEALARGVSLEALLLERLEQRSAQRGSNAQLSTDETALLETINQGFPESFWMRYRALIALRDQHALSDAEHAELIAMSDETEQLSAQRAEALGALARLQHESIYTLIQKLGLRPLSLTA